MKVYSKHCVHSEKNYPLVFILLNFEKFTQIKFKSIPFASFRRFVCNNNYTFGIVIKWLVKQTLNKIGYFENLSLGNFTKVANSK